MKKLTEASVIVKNLEKITEIAKSCENHFPIQFDVHYCAVSDEEYLEGVRMVAEMLKDPSWINATEIVCLKAFSFYIMVDAKVGDWEVSTKTYDAGGKDLDRVRRDLSIDIASTKLADVLQNQGLTVNLISPIDTGQHIVTTKSVNGYRIYVKDRRVDNELKIELISVNEEIGALTDITILDSASDFMSGRTTIKSILQKHGLAHLLYPKE